MNKKIMSLLMVLFVFVLAACNGPSDETSMSTSEPVSTKQAKIELVLGFQVVTEIVDVKDETRTLFDVLQDRFDITYKSYDFGPMLESISTKEGRFTIEAPEGSFIAFYVNGEPSMVGVNEIYVKKDHTYRLALEWWDQDAHIAYIINRFIDQHAATYVNDQMLDIHVVIALAHLGLLEDYISLEEALADYSSIDSDNISVSELYKAILTIHALGGDVSSFVRLLVERNDTKKYSAPYALIGLNCGHHGVDVSAYESELLETLIGTNMPSQALGLDLSGITLAALSPYIEREDVSAVIQDYLMFLENNLNEFGGIRDEHFDENASSLAQLIIGLIAIDVNRLSNVLTNENANLIHRLIHRLLDFSNDDGTFYWSLDSDHPDLSFSTPQAFLALVLYQKYIEQEQAIRFYDFSSLESLEK
ncbi:MAG TPA: DUF4430 domain-containing protein [Haloplasmataceae bacterium]